jgi:hypothetical protein
MQRHLPSYSVARCKCCDVPGCQGVGQFPPKASHVLLSVHDLASFMRRRLVSATAELPVTVKLFTCFNVVRQ